MQELQRNEDVTGEAVRASLAVVEGAIELGRAEAKLALLQAKTSVTSGFVVLLFVFAAISFVELALVLIAISPLYSALTAPPSPRPLLLSLGIACGLAVTSGLIARAAWQRMIPRKTPKISTPPEPAHR